MCQDTWSQKLWDRTWGESWASMGTWFKRQNPCGKHDYTHLQSQCHGGAKTGGPLELTGYRPSERPSLKETRQRMTEQDTWHPSLTSICAYESMNRHTLVHTTNISHASQPKRKSNRNGDITNMLCFTLLNLAVNITGTWSPTPARCISKIIDCYTPHRLMALWHFLSHSLPDNLTLPTYLQPVWFFPNLPCFPRTKVKHLQTQLPFLFLPPRSQ